MLPIISTAAPELWRRAGWRIQTRVQSTILILLQARCTQAHRLLMVLHIHFPVLVYVRERRRMILLRMEIQEIRTIKNILSGALLPCWKSDFTYGAADGNDSTRKVSSDTMTSWYNKWSANPSSYDYNNYRDLSTSNRAKDLTVQAL